ncbi:MAG TPA: DUF5069 domain-containing protein [Opitutaceae bacterium]|jgi:gluconokinase|nr:DUF5069 domain-containing protein [Opitutaceae bacterium]
MSVPGLRFGDSKVGGIVFFGRMLDKIRLQAAGKLPPGYNLGTATPTFFDARCCRFLGIDYDALSRRTLHGGSDEEILAWCYLHGRQPSEEEIEIWNDFMLKRGLRDSSSERLQQSKEKLGLGDRTDIQTWFEMHRADEERFPGK